MNVTAEQSAEHLQNTAIITPSKELPHTNEQHLRLLKPTYKSTYAQEECDHLQRILYHEAFASKAWCFVSVVCLHVPMPS